MSEVEAWYKVVKYLYVLALLQVKNCQNNVWKSNFLVVGSSFLFNADHFNKTESFVLIVQVYRISIAYQQTQNNYTADLHGSSEDRILQWTTIFKIP